MLNTIISLLEPVLQVVYLQTGFLLIRSTKASEQSCAE